MKGVRGLFFCVLTALIGLLILRPEIYVTSVYNGFVLFAVSVLPAMFPFFFFSKLLTSMGAADKLGRLLKRPFARLYNSPAIGAYIFALSVLSGYPIGAKQLSDCYKAGLISTTDCKRITAFASTSGPLFIVGTVGTAMLGSKNAGYNMLLAHVLAALINGLIYRGKGSLCAETALLAPVTVNSNRILSEAITSSVSSIMIVGGYVAVFNMLADVVIHTGLCGALATPLSYVFRLIGMPPDTAAATIVGLIEVTRGSLELAAVGADISKAAAIACGLISFGGLGVTLQSITFLSETGVSPAYYLLTKLTHAVIAFILSFILSGIFL